MSELVPGLVVAHSHRLEDLTDVAVKFSASYPLPPLTDETVLVQSNGIAQWLKINMAQANGIAAMLDVTLPARFVWRAYRAVLGEEIPTSSPFDKEPLTWRIMRLLPGLIAANEQGYFSALKFYLDGDTDQRKIYQLSVKLADLYDQYQVYRADWLDHWVAGKDHLDKASEPLTDDQRWQAILWRALSNDIGIDDFWNNRAELHRRFVHTARAATQRPADIPPRIIVFGISSLPQQVLEVLDALKGYTQILLCVNNPSCYHWADIVDGKAELKQAMRAAQQQRLQRKQTFPEQIDDDLLHTLAQPLLAAWGKQGRDYIHLLDLYDETQAKRTQFQNTTFELFDEIKPVNLLQQLQNDILHLRPLAETKAQWPPVDAADRSIQFHCCHSPKREVEVLHDQLLEAFAEDATLQPRDVMVMVPDIDTYAPFIDAVFGFNVSLTGADARRAIPYTIADQGQRHRAPLLIALELVLKADQLRFDQSDILTLLAVPAVQRRFAISEDDLPQIKQWMNEAGARWGLNAAHREQFFVPATAATNSWWFAIKRMLLGYAMGDSEAWHGIQPYAEVAGLGADLAGRLTDLVRVLEAWWDESSTPAPMATWSARIRVLMAELFSTEQPLDDDDDRLLVLKLTDELTALQARIDEAAHEQPLELAIVREAWLERIDQQSLNQRFMAGSVNFATLMPMRAIPFRRVYVMGMNEGDYPRTQTYVDFDLMAEHYRAGDRSRRDDDRYLFLEALLSARDSFYVSWVGFSARDNSERPPSVLVAQLYDHLIAGWQLESLVTEHKLHPFNPAYFQPGTRWFSYAAEWINAHQGMIDDNDTPQVAEVITLERPLRVIDVAKFMREPAQLYFNWRLDTYFGDDHTETLDSESFGLTPLTRWSSLQRLFTQASNLLKYDPSAEYSVVLARE